MNENCSECIYMDNGMCKLKPAACLNYDHFQWSPMIQISVSDFEKKYISRLAFDEMKARAEKAEERVYELRNALNLILDQVDYTSGACKINEMVGAVLGQNLIEVVHSILKGGAE